MGMDFAVVPSSEDQALLDVMDDVIAGRERAKALRHVMDFTGLDVLAEKPIRGSRLGWNPCLDDSNFKK